MTDIIYNTIPPGQSNEIFITLPTYNLRWFFRKSQILRKYPQSLLATTLEQDPTATEIELTQPFITPTIIETVGEIIDIGGVPCLTVEEVTNNDFQQASRYLAMPILNIIGTQGYVAFQNEFVCTSKGIPLNILDPKMTLSVFRDVIIFCFTNEANEVGEYLARNTKVTC